MVKLQEVEKQSGGVTVNEGGRRSSAMSPMGAH
jgi:hypothetical protein